MKEPRGGFVALLQFFSVHSAATGKAVRFGHSCAAVTHHESPFRTQGGNTASRATGEGGEEEHVCDVQRPKPSGQMPNKSAALPGRLKNWRLDLGVWSLRRRR